MDVGTEGSAGGGEAEGEYLVLIRVDVGSGWCLEEKMLS